MSLAAESALVSVSKILETIRHYAFDSRQHSILPFIPRAWRYVILFILLINCRSLPFVWHIRVFRPVIYLRLKWWSLKLSSKETKKKWLTSLSPIGEHPFEKMTVFNTWASPDESDYNWHLSNSSYAKTLDSARLKAALEYFPTFFRDGGRMALGATHYGFLREIPILADYEVRISIASWDEKWLYLMARFVTRKPQRKTGVKENQKPTIEANTSASAMPVPVPLPIRTPYSDIPTPSVTPGTQTPEKKPSNSSQALSSDAPSLTQITREEAAGETLHCVAISQLCFKVGRITVPPALALASSGFCLTQDQWKTVDTMRSNKEITSFLRGDWRKVKDDSEKWWVTALKGVDEQRFKNLEIVQKFREGLDGLKHL